LVGANNVYVLHRGQIARAGEVSEVDPEQIAAPSEGSAH
jgi:hypothetical protein